MSTQNEKLISIIKGLIKESLEEDPILLDSPRKRVLREVNEKKRGGGGK